MIRRHVAVVLAASALLGIGLGTASARPKPKVKRASRVAARPTIRAPLPQPPRPAPANPAEVYAFRSIEVKPHPNAVGRPDLIGQVSAMIARLDPRPPSRNVHYGWLGRGKYVHYGYHGQILRAVPATSGWRATIRISPRVVSSQGAQTLVVDMVDEEYEMVNGVLNFLGATQVPNTAPGIVFID
jgi:hypothetical protein